MKFNHLNVPESWQHYWSRYPEGYTILEALISWVSQVDSMVDNVNDWNTYLDDFVLQFDTELQHTLTTILKDWQTSGFIDIVISTALQWQLDDYITTNEQDKRSLDTQLQQTNDLKADKTQVFTMANMGQDIREALTGGSVAVVGVDSVLTDNIVNGAVTGQKTNFLTVDQTKNLIDKSVLTANMRVNGHINGALVETPDFFATDFIALTPNEDYYFGGMYNGYCAFYDVNKEYISGYGVASGSSYLPSPFTVPSNATYARFTLNGAGEVGTAWLNKVNIKPDNFGYVLTKTRLDEKVKPLETSFIKTYGNTNLIDKSKIKPNTYIRGQVDGVEITSENLWATDYVLLKPNTPYYNGSVYAGYYAFYDVDKKYISGFGISSSQDDLPNPFTIPSNAVYARFTLHTADFAENCWISTVNTKPYDTQQYIIDDNVHLSGDNGLTPTNYTGNEITLFSNIIAIGDSLTRGTFNTKPTGYHENVNFAYPAYLSKLTGVSVTNKGIGGKTTQEWYELNQSDDLSGYDCALIQLGVNDVIYEVPTQTTLNYLQLIVAKLKSENKGIKLFVSTIIPATSYSGSGYDTLSQAIRGFANSTANCYLVDLATYGHTGDEVAYNNGHLSALGYMTLAKDWKAYVSYIINQNKLEFRNIQFIGTDLTY